jgi:hypothetical protein
MLNNRFLHHYYRLYPVDPVNSARGGQAWQKLKKVSNPGCNLADLNALCNWSLDLFFEKKSPIF